MKYEIEAAVGFLSRLIKNHEQFADKFAQFRLRLEALLFEHCQDHWFPDDPLRGQGYRCIRVNETERMDPILKRAAEDCGLNYNDLMLPNELTIWVDPNEVSCRLGEHKGSYCVVAKSKNGKIYANEINIENLEKKSAELAKQASAEIMNGYKRNKKVHSNQDSSRIHHSPSVNYGTNSPVHLNSNCSSPIVSSYSPLVTYAQNEKMFPLNSRRNILCNRNYVDDDMNGNSNRHQWPCDLNNQ